MAAANPRGLFLDISGSMQSYHADGTVAKLATPIEATLKTGGQLQVYGFNEQVRRLPGVAAISPGSVAGYTHLGKVVEQALRDKLELFWLVTDNLEHTAGGAEGAGTEHFYNQLRGPEVQRVTVFPVVVGPGKPALVVYAILMSQSAAEAYTASLASFQRGATGMLRTDALQMKPLDRGTVTSQVVPQLENGPRRGKLVYETGKPIRKTIDAVFASSLSHIAIVDCEIDVVQREPVFQPTSLLVAEQKTLYINPKRITVQGGSVSAQHYEIGIELSRMRLKPGLSTLWNAAFGKSSEEARLDVTLLIKVPASKFQLHEDFLSKYSAATPEAAKTSGHVFALDKLPSLMSDKVTSVEVHHEMVFPVKYPFYPTAIWMLLVVVLALGGYLLYRNIPKLLPGGKGKWRVSVEGLDGNTSPAAVAGGKVLVDGEELGVIRGDAFTPTAPAEWSGGSAPAVLAHGTVVDLRVRRRPVRLKFEEKGKQAAKPTPAPERKTTRR
ncbi:MAG: hypothetical protein QM757_26030 [Paludibaculum sp.]